MDQTSYIYAFIHICVVTIMIKEKGYDFEREGESGRSGRSGINKAYIYEI